MTLVTDETLNAETWSMLLLHTRDYWFKRVLPLFGCMGDADDELPVGILDGPVFDSVRPGSSSFYFGH